MTLIMMIVFIAMSLKRGSNELQIKIRQSSKGVYEYYYNILEEIKNEDFSTASSCIAQKVLEWEDNGFDVKPYYLDQEETDGFTVSSFKFEYCIFNLVYI